MNSANLSLTHNTTGTKITMQNIGAKTPFIVKLSDEVATVKESDE